MHTSTLALIEQIGELGYRVFLGSDDVQAIHERTGERFIVRGDAWDDMVEALGG